jgi:hypothetical protein
VKPADFAEALAALARTPGWDERFMHGIVSGIEAQLDAGTLTREQIAADLDALDAKLKGNSAAVQVLKQLRQRLKESQKPGTNGTN